MEGGQGVRERDKAEGQGVGRRGGAREGGTGQSRMQGGGMGHERDKV